MGFTLNHPVSAGSTDVDYLQAFREDLRPAMDRFHPDLILISAGFDAYAGDPLSRIAVTPDGFAALTREVADMARVHCKGRLVSVLEGGYDPSGLAACVEAHLTALLAAE